MNFISVKSDCDNDCLLVRVKPDGPVCHTGSDTCWMENNESGYGFLSELESTISKRRNSGKVDSSYVASLFKMGINKIAQKVGEEAVEVAIAATMKDKNLTMEESADLLYHLLVLWRKMDIELGEIGMILKKRRK